MKVLRILIWWHGWRAAVWEARERRDWMRGWNADATLAKVLGDWHRSMREGAVRWIERLERDALRG